MFLLQVNGGIIKNINLKVLYDYRLFELIVNAEIILIEDKSEIEIDINTKSRLERKK